MPFFGGKKGGKIEPPTVPGANSKKGGVRRDSKKVAICRGTVYSNGYAYLKMM